MYGFGDCPEPLMESAKIIEDVVHRQMRSLVHKACEVADRRESKIVTDQDFIFLLRSNKMKLRRLLKYLEIKEFKASMHKILDSEMCSESLEDLTANPLKKKRAYHKIINLIDNTGELSENQSVVDSVKYNRKLRAEMISRKIDESRYIEYSRARCISFANRNQHKFTSWIGCQGFFQVEKISIYFSSFLDQFSIDRMIFYGSPDHTGLFRPSHVFGKKKFWKTLLHWFYFKVS